MKYLIIIFVFALAGCGASEKEKVDACTFGAITAINALRDAGATLPEGTDRTKISTTIALQCEFRK